MDCPVLLDVGLYVGDSAVKFAQGWVNAEGCALGAPSGPCVESSCSKLWVSCSGRRLHSNAEWIAEVVLTLRWPSCQGLLCG